MDIDALFDKYPFLEQMLGFLDKYAGPMLAVGFFLFMLYIFYWALVLLPRRVRQIYSTLLKKGYLEVSNADPEKLQVLLTLSPIYFRTPRKDYPIPEWEVEHACKLKLAENTRYILNVARMQVDRPGATNNRSRRESIMILEKCALNFSEAIYMTPTSYYADWESRFGLFQVRDGLDQEFLDQYHVFTKSGKVDYFPGALRDTLMEVLKHFVAREMGQKYYIPGMMLKFRKDGWGIGAGERLYQLKKMELMIDVADMISRALSVRNTI